MSKGKFSRSLFIASFILACLPLFIAAQTSPEAFLGFKVGADKKLADYSQIQAYFQKLDQESPLVTLFPIGTSTMKKPMFMAVITSEENMAKLDSYREITKKLRDPRTLSPEDAKKLAKEGKVILLITANIHASEIAASQMAMELAFRLVTGDTPFDAKKVLSDVIILLVPTINPDGQQMECDWYKKYLGTKYEGGNLPWTYHYYAGHDNNRDFFMTNLNETKAVTNILYHDWLPQIHIDEHQMGPNAARLFIPPFMDPPVPNVQPLLWRTVNLCGTSMAYDLQKNGFRGVVHGRSFTGWWIGACDDTSWLHNVAGILSEMASVNLASPIYVEPTEIPKSYTQRMIEFPDPWPGGWWRLRDIVDYEMTLSLSLINTACRHKEDFLLNFYQMYKNSIEQKDKNQPFAFVISARQHDYPTMLRMLEKLQLGGVEIHQAKEDFVADGKVYPAGSFVVLLAQPYKPYAWALLEKQKYPDLREYPGGPPIPPYDNAGWTLPLQMGVVCDQVNGQFTAKLEKLEKVPVPATPAPVSTSGYIVLDSRNNASYSTVFELLKAKAEIFRSKDKITAAEHDAAPGSFIIKNSLEVQKALPGLLEKWHLSALPLDDSAIAGIAKAALKNPRIGLYQSWHANMDEGWTRYVFDDLGVPFVTLHNSDFKAAKKEKLNLKAKYDVIVFAGESADMIKTGKVDPNSPWARYMTPMPLEYEGGIEKEGVEALKAFVEEGGIMVTLNEACELAFKDFEVPARNALEKVERTKFFCPTSILKINVDNTSPIGYGLQEETPAVFSDSPAMDTWLPRNEWNRKVVASYPEDEILLSGWLLGDDVIARQAAVVDTQHKKGHIVLIGFPCQMRAQSHGTYKFLLNALLYPESQ